MPLTEFNPFEVLNRIQDLADLQTVGKVYVYFEAGRMKGQWAVIDKLEHQYTRDRCWKTYFHYTTLSEKTGKFSEKYNAKWYVGELDEELIENMSAVDFFGRKLKVGSPVMTVDNGGFGGKLAPGIINSIINHQIVVTIMDLEQSKKSKQLKILDTNCYLIESKDIIKTLVTAKLKQE